MTDRGGASWPYIPDPFHSHLCLDPSYIGFVRHGRGARGDDRTCGSTGEQVWVLEELGCWGLLGSVRVQLARSW